MLQEEWEQILEEQMAPELGASGDWNRGAIGTGIGGADGISVWKRLSSLSSGDE